MQTLPDSRPESIKDIYNAAVDHVRISRLTDAEFIYAPSQIALGALYLAGPSLAEQWARAKGLGQNSTALAIAKEVAALINRENERGGGINVDEVREVDKRLRLCRHPEKIPGTKAYASFLLAKHSLKLSIAS